jgi:hypothetical protein
MSLNLNSLSSFFFLIKYLYWNSCPDPCYYTYYCFHEDDIMIGLWWEQIGLGSNLTGGNGPPSLIIFIMGFCWLGTHTISKLSLGCSDLFLKLSFFLIKIIQHLTNYKKSCLLLLLFLDQLSLGPSKAPTGGTFEHIFPPNFKGHPSPKWCHPQQTNCRLITKFSLATIFNTKNL